MVKPADVKIVKISAAAFPKGAFSKVEDVLDRPVISNILWEAASSPKRSSRNDYFPMACLS
jgi:hypothetical protein